MNAPAATAPWKILDLLTWGTEYLKKRDISQPRLSMEWMLAKTLNLKRLELYLQFERLVKEPELAVLKAMLQKRASHTPVQYILGQWDFYGLPFAVSEHALIPRPETEILVECVLKHAAQHDINAPSYGLDLGTGTGNIAVSLLKNMPQAKCLAVDLSLQALELAKTNAEAHGVAGRMPLLQGSWFEPLGAHHEQAFDWIVSNPPYIASAQWEALAPDIKLFEPRQALWGGEDGLNAYRVLAAEAPRFVKPGGLLALEIGDDQEAAVSELLQAQGKLDFVESVKDHNGIKRVILAKRTNG